MSYLIRYGQPNDLSRFSAKRNNHYWIIIFVFLSALLIGIRVFLPEVAERAVDALWFWDESTVTAFYSMLDQIRQGQYISDAVDAFCRSIIENANLPH